MLNEAVRRWMDDLSAQGIFITDTELTIRGWNHWLELRSGRSASQMIGQNLFDAYPELVERSLDKYYEDVLAGQVRLLSHRFHHYLLPMPPEIVDTSFVEMQQSARIAPLLENDRVVGTITVIDDVTERISREEQLMQLFDRERAARQEAEAANRMKDEFLATVSHELRTPLNAIVGWLKILRQAEITPDSLVRGLDTIERNVKAQSQIVEDILDVSRIITGKLSLDARPVDLVPIVKAAVETVRLAATVKEIRLEVDLGDRETLVSGDPNRLQQIIWNLVSNALKFTSKGGTVRVQLSRTESQVEVSVRDTGKGITPEFLPFVFDRFRQADSTSTRQHAGIGLGLAIVRHLAEIHGGTVQAASPGEGQGATFTVTLPRLPADTLIPPAAPREAPSVEVAEETLFATASVTARAEVANLGGLRVLIVDDDPDAREMLQILLRQFGAEVKITSSTRGALNMLEHWIPDVLVSDIGMPNEDGYSLIRQVRTLKAERGGQIPAIALTGYTRPEDQQQLLAAGYQVPLAKPVDVEKLVDAITELALLKRPIPSLAEDYL